jgi:transcriptional regulator with XRE-family HTH domain
MTHTNPVAEAWGKWLSARLAALDMSQADLRQQLDAAGTPTKKQTVSQWVNGQNSTDPNTAAAIAAVLNADPLEALRAAGHEPIADLIATLMDGRPPRPAGATPDPIAAAIQDILDDKRLTPVEQRDALAHLNRRVKSVLAEVNGIIDAIIASRGDVESA